MLSDVSIAELDRVEDVWENRDGSLGIVFSSLIFKTRKDLSDSYPALFESLSGVMERDGQEYYLVGTLELWEGKAYCYAWPTDLSNGDQRREELLIRVDKYIEGEYSVKTSTPDELDRLMACMIADEEAECL